MLYVTYNKKGNKIKLSCQVLTKADPFTIQLGTELNVSV